MLAGPADEAGAEVVTLRRELAESRRQFGSVLRSLSGLFYRCELQAPWRMSFVSEGVQELTGYPAAELERYDGWSEIIVSEDRTTVEKAVALGVSERRNFDLAYRIRRKSGEIRWVTERGNAVYDDNGVPLFLEGVISDISGRMAADELQKTTLARWKRTLDAIPQMVWTMAADGSDEFYNAQWILFTGYQLSDHVGVSRADLVHPDDRERVTKLWNDCFEEGKPYEAQYRLKHVGGGYRWILSRGEPDVDSSGKPLRWYGTCTDINDEVIGREALQASEAVSRTMIEASPDCIALLDVLGNVKYLNPAALQTLGLSDTAPLLGRSWAENFPDSSRSAAVVAITQATLGATGRFTARRRNAHGDCWLDILVAPITDDQAQLSSLISIARDITHQKTAEDRVRWAANHDPLTQLPNRALFQQTLDKAIADAHATGGYVTVLMLDLDDFKRTNDGLGHDAGDALLTEFATRLRALVRADDMVARLGGDEFAVLLQGVGKKDDVEAVVQSIKTGLKAPCHFDGKLLDIRTSIGASSFPRDGDSRTVLLKHADIALYVAKSAGRGVFRIFEAAMRADAQKRLSVLSLARDAVREKRIVPYYQPKVDLRTGRLDGFEALLRWKHPSKGIQTAERIAGAFQDGALAADISDLMIDSVIADMRNWADAGVPFQHIAVNAAAAEFRNGQFADRLIERLHRANLPASCLQLEVTETVFLGRGAEHVENALKALSREGVQIALDDFGTGYASLSHLNHFPVDVIKIDRSFIRKLSTSDHDAAIVRAVIKLGRSLGIKIVAEGIEAESQADFLRKHRCHSGQGFLFSKAVPGIGARSLVSKWDETRFAA
ncbi:EAL domain-containing protein [Sphingomonas sp. GCM10030256]|uniref:sensor domain-containing protein n=1 Tax=Sphingomonas sp. GCM10030256 TaxID=3273427 RepID=UPI003615F631